MEQAIEVLAKFSAHILEAGCIAVHSQQRTTALIEHMHGRHSELEKYNDKLDRCAGNSKGKLERTFQDLVKMPDTI